MPFRSSSFQSRIMESETSTRHFPTLDISFLNLPSPFHSSFPSPALVPSFNPSPSTSNNTRSRAWWKILSPIKENFDGDGNDEMVEDGLSLMMRREVEREKKIAKKKLVWEMVALGGVAIFLVGLVVVCSSGAGGEGMGLGYPPIRRKG